MTAPQPFVPPECDLRTFPYMPVFIDQMLTSDFFTQASGDEFRAGFVLYIKSFRELPAGSLPSDIKALTRLAELGQDVAKLKRIRSVALHGWIACADGRLHHRVVAEKALEAWIERLKGRLKSMRGNVARWGSSLDSSEVEVMLGRAVAYLAAINPQSKHLEGLPKGIRVASHKDLPRGSNPDPSGIPQGDPPRIPSFEAIPSGYPSQEITSGEVVSLAHAGTHTREAGR